MAGHDLAGEHKAAGIDFGRAGGVGGAQVMRGDDQAIGAARPQPRQRHRAAACARDQVPREAAHDQRRNASALSDRHALPWLGEFSANPFNPETRPRHHLENPRISGARRNEVQNQDLTSRAA